MVISGGADSVDTPENALKSHARQMVRLKLGRFPKCVSRLPHKEGETFGGKAAHIVHQPIVRRGQIQHANLRQWLIWHSPATERCGGNGRGCRGRFVRDVGRVGIVQNGRVPGFDPPLRKRAALPKPERVGAPKKGDSSTLPSETPSPAVSSRCGGVRQSRHLARPTPFRKRARGRDLLTDSPQPPHHQSTVYNICLV